jgi:hypothetical protein
MGQLGATSLSALDRSFVEYPEAWHGVGMHREPEPASDPATPDTAASDAARTAADAEESRA